MGLSLVLAFLSFYSYGQSFEPVLIKIDEQAGLPDEEIYSMAQDKTGLFWLGTDSGLYSFDGKKFTYHRHEKQTGASVFNLTIDTGGNLWYNNFSGQIFMRSKDSIQLVETFEKEGERGLMPLEKANTGILAFKKQFLLQYHLDRVDTLDYFDELNVLTNMVKHNDHSIFFRHDTLFQIKGNSCLPLQTYTNLPKYREKVGLFTYGEQVFANFFGNNRNYIIDISSSTTKEQEGFTAVRNLSIIQIIEKEAGYWFLTGDGAFLYRVEGGSFILKKHLLAGKTVTDLLEDQEGFMWFSTLNRGLYLLPYQECQQLKLPYEEDGFIGQTHTYRDSVLYFMSDENSISRYSILTNEYLKQELDSYHNQYFTVNPYSDELLVFAGESIRVSNPKDLKLKYAFKGDVPKEVISLNAKQYLTNFYYGVRKWNEGFHSLDVQTFFKRAKTLAIADNHQDVYIAFQDGLCYSDIEMKEKTPILVEENTWTPTTMTSQPQSNIVWAAKEGVLISLENGKIVRQFNQLKGIRSSQIQSIVADTNYLFIAHKYHIQALDFTKDTIYDFPYYPFLRQSAIRDIKLLGEWLVINTGSEIFRIPKTHFTTILNNQKVCDLYLNSFAINGEEQTIQNKYQLRNDEDRIELRMSLNRAFPADRFEYRYRWNFKSRWQSFSEGADLLVLDNIPPGDNQLTIHVKAKFENWDIEPIHIQIFRSFPWWRQWWFYSLVALGIASFTFLLMWIRNRRKQSKLHLRLERLQNEREISHLQLENLRSQMNPHFVFNALNSIQDYIVSNERKLASKFLVKFSRLMRLYLEHSRTPQITLEEEIEALKLYLALEKDRFDKSLQFTLYVEPLLPIKQLYIPSLLLQPYVENALNHGLLHKEGNRSINISFKSLDENLVCIIEDNGIGRALAQKMSGKRTNHKSFSMGANANRIALINHNLDQKLSVQIDDIYTDSGAVGGTKVRITIPI